VIIIMGLISSLMVAAKNSHQEEQQNECDPSVRDYLHYLKKSTRCFVHSDIIRYYRNEYCRKWQAIDVEVMLEVK
jgi:hypothetical protein